MIKKLVSLVSFSFIGVVFTYLFQTLGTYMLTPVDFGYLAKWLTDLGLFSVFLVLGLDYSLTYHARLGEDMEKNISKNFLIYFLAFIIAQLSVYLADGINIYYITLFFSILCYSFFTVINSSFQYKEHFRVYNYLIVLKPVIVFITFISIYLVYGNIVLDQAYIIYSMSTLVIISIAALIYVSFFSFKKPIKIFRIDYYTYGIKSIFHKILSIGLYSATVYCISYYDDYETVAYFFVASAISKIAWVIPDAAGNILYPIFLKLNIKYTSEAVKNNLFLYAQIVFLLNIVGTFIFIMLGDYILNLIYTTSYSVVYLPVIILLIGNQGMVYFKLISRYLAARNDWKPIYISLATSIIINVILNLFLIPKYGLIGASIATGLSFWICGFVISFAYKESLIEFLNLKSLLNTLKLRSWKSL